MATATYQENLSMGSGTPYGKNSGFYETWLKDCETVKMMV